MLAITIMRILITAMNFFSTHCTACLRQINAYILCSGSYRLLRGLHLLVSPLSVLGLVSCVSIVLFCADNSYNTAPQAGTGRKACMNAHLQQTHTHTLQVKLSSLAGLQHFSSVSNNHPSQPPYLFIPHTSLPPSITLHLVERERGRIAILCESPQPSLQLPGSSVSGEGIVQRNSSTLPTVSLLFREKPQGRGVWRRTVYTDGVYLRMFGEIRHACQRSGGCRHTLGPITTWPHRQLQVIKNPVQHLRDKTLLNVNRTRTRRMLLHLSINYPTEVHQRLHLTFHLLKDKGPQVQHELMFTGEHIVMRTRPIFPRIFMRFVMSEGNS